MAELMSFVNCFWPFGDIYSIWNPTLFLVFSSVLFTSDPVRPAQVLAQVLRSALQTVNELVDTFLIKIRLFLSI